MRSHFFYTEIVQNGEGQESCNKRREDNRRDKKADEADYNDSLILSADPVGRMQYE